MEGFSGRIRQILEQSNMIQITILVLLGNLLLFGLYLFLSAGTKELKNLSFRKNLLMGCINVGCTVFGATCIHRFDILLILLMLIQGILLSLEVKQEGMTVTIMKTIGYVLLVVVSELMGLFFLNRYLEKAGLSIQHFYYDALVNILLVTCLIGLLLLCAYQILCSGKNFQKIMWVLVGVRVIQEIIGLHTGIFFILAEGSNTKTSVIYFSFVLIDYLICTCIIYKSDTIEIRSVRPEIQTNFYEYYTNLEEEQRKIRKMYHDMKNQIMIYENTEGLKDVFAPMLDNIQTMSRFHHTGCPTLDMLLFNGERMAAEKGIDFDAVISEGCFSFMKEEDISVIFSNAIMNAMEACEKIKTGLRKIQIKAGINKGDVMLYVKNTVSAERSKGKFSTDKHNKKSHGIGLTSIRETVEKYGGYVSVIEENQTVQIAIIFAEKGNYEEA